MSTKRLKPAVVSLNCHTCGSDSTLKLCRACYKLFCPMHIYPTSYCLKCFSPKLSRAAERVVAGRKLCPDCVAMYTPGEFGGDCNDHRDPGREYVCTQEYRSRTGAAFMSRKWWREYESLVAAFNQMFPDPPP